MTQVFLPLKPRHLAKQRLRAVLTARKRSLLAEAMARDVLDALVAVGELISQVTVVGGDACARAIAAEYADSGVGYLEEPLHGGLNEALEAALHGASAARSEILILHGDIPLADPPSLRTLIATHRSREGTGLTLVSDRFGSGTNALLLSAGVTVPMLFGDASAGCFAQIARDRDLRYRSVDLPRLRFDIDLPGDLIDLQSTILEGTHGPGALYTRRLLGSEAFADFSRPPPMLVEEGGGR